MLSKNAITDDLKHNCIKNACKGTQDQVTGMPPHKFLVQLDTSLSSFSNMKDVNRSC